MMERNNVIVGSFEAHGSRDSVQERTVNIVGEKKYTIPVKGVEDEFELISGDELMESVWYKRQAKMGNFLTSETSQNEMQEQIMMLSKQVEALTEMLKRIESDHRIMVERRLRIPDAMEKYSVCRNTLMKCAKEAGALIKQGAIPYIDTKRYDEYLDSRRAA